MTSVHEAASQPRPRRARAGGGVRMAQSSPRRPGALMSGMTGHRRSRGASGQPMPGVANPPQGHSVADHTAAWGWEGGLSDRKQPRANGTTCQRPQGQLTAELGRASGSGHCTRF